MTLEATISGAKAVKEMNYSKKMKVRLCSINFRTKFFFFVPTFEFYFNWAPAFCFWTFFRA